MKLKNFAVIFALSLVFPTVLTAAKDSDNTVLDFERFVEPMYPMSLAFEGIVEGSMEIAVDINDDGTVADWITTRTSHKRYIPEIERVIDRWVFKPATSGGVPIPAVYMIEFTFSHGGLTFISGRSTELYLNELAGKFRDEKVVFELYELDKIPEPVNVVLPKRFEDMDPEDFKGRIVIDFFIDETGSVRLPVVTDIEGPMELAHSAYIAISSWKFEPPMMKGKPVTARARQPFDFTGQE